MAGALCVSCSVIGAIETAAVDGASSIYGTLAGPMETLMLSIAGVYLLTKITIGLLSNKVEFRALALEAAYLSFGSWLLAAPENYLDLIHQPMTQFMYGVAGITISSDLTGTPTLSGVALAVENNFSKVVAVSLALFDDASISDPFGYFAGLVLIIPFFLQMLVFVGQVSWSLGLTLVPYALGPIFIMCGAFPWTRRILLSMFDFYLSAAMVVITSGLFISLGSSAASSFIDAMPLGPDGEAGNLMGYVGGSNFIGALVVGFLSVGLLYKTEAIAAYVSNRIDFTQRSVTQTATKAAGAALSVARGGLGAARAIGSLPGNIISRFRQ